MRQTIAIALIVGLSFAGGGACGKKDKNKDKKGDTSAKGGDDKGGGGGAKNYAALTADAPLENITPADKPPFETLAFKMTGKRSKGGFPIYDAYNLGTKTVKYAYIMVYGYDKDGKQVVKTSPGLSWNGEIKPGAKSDWPIELGSFDDGIVPENAVSFDICYSSIKFDGDANQTSEDARCPDNKEKGK
ncbi:MAG TPA: hypothetical protein VL172_12025 [Kofleriaceae bacterium]|nr:hypothetical protein [Kofleriaceae bacterium]